MDQNEILEPYTAGDFAKDMAVDMGRAALGVALGYAVLVVAGFVISKVQDRKAKKNSAKN